MPSDTRKLRLPRALARYACARTLVCCQAPWGVYLDADEPGRIARHLADVGGLDGGAARRRVHAALESPGRGLIAMRRDAAGCSQLAPAGAERGCALQHTAGLGALPRTCQAFPREIARFGPDVEVAFLLDCPTVCRLLVADGTPFRWADAPGEARAFPYPVGRVARAPFPWGDGHDADHTALVAWREGWWARLEDACARRALGPALAALLRRPAAPGGDPARDDDDLTALIAWSPAWAEPLADALARLHRSEASLPAPPPVETLREGPPVSALDSLLGDHAGALALAAGLLLQHAGVHDSRPLLDAARGAAWQTLVSAALAARLVAAGLGPADALVMALSTAAQVARTLPTSHHLGASF